MTDKNLTEIVVVLDRSGSMSGLVSDVEGGFKTFLKEQEKLPGKAVVTLYQFDDKYETVFEERPLREVDGLKLVPRGGTALLDAVGRAINEVGDRLSKKKESKRPGGVIFMIITDGQENASREIERPQLRDMIKHQEEKYSWRFLYLSADEAAFEDARIYGINPNLVGKFGKNQIGVRGLFAGASNTLGTYRDGTSKGGEEGKIILDSLCVDKDLGGNEDPVEVSSNGV